MTTLGKQNKTCQFKQWSPGWHKVIRCLVAQIFRQKCLPKIELRIIVFLAKRDPHVWVKNAAMVTLMMEEVIRR